MKRHEPQTETARKLIMLGSNDTERGKPFGISGDSVFRWRLYNRVPRKIAAMLAAEPALTINALIDRIVIPTMTTPSSDATPTIPDSTNRT